MSVDAIISKSTSVGGKSFTESTTISTNGGIVVERSIPKAQTGVLTTRTSDTAGSITMDDSGHTVGTGDTLDIYWTDGQARQATVGTVAGTTVPFTLATGDALPTATTALAVSVPTVVDTDVDGDNVKLITSYSTKKSTFVFTGSDLVEDYFRIYRGAAGGTNAWYENTGEPNPIAGDVLAKTFMSHNDSTAASIMRYAISYD